MATSVIAFISLQFHGMPINKREFVPCRYSSTITNKMVRGKGSRYILSLMDCVLFYVVNLRLWYRVVYCWTSAEKFSNCVSFYGGKFSLLSTANVVPEFNCAPSSKESDIPVWRCPLRILYIIVLELQALSEFLSLAFPKRNLILRTFHVDKGL